MTFSHVVSLLERWVTQLEAYLSVEAPFERVEGVDDALAKRQQIIDTLQTLDGELTKIRHLRATGFPEFSPLQRKEIERLINTGNELVLKIGAADAQAIEKAKLLRSELLSQVENIRLHRRYLPTNILSNNRSSVIVDRRY